MPNSVDSGDALLIVMSARREMSWRAFKDAFDEVRTLGVVGDGVESDEPAGPARWRVVRLLSALGHCDASFAGGEGRIVVAPPVLATLPWPGPARAVLCGARGPDTRNALGRACGDEGVRLEVTAQGDRAVLAPARLVVEGDLAALERVADQLGVELAVTPPAWAIAALSGTLDESLAALTWVAGPEPNWQREDFDTVGLRFAQPGGRGGRLQLSRYQDPVRQRWLYYLRRRGEAAAVDPDWGRYAVLRAAARKALAYNRRTGELDVPWGCPLPTLLARSAVLASGWAPATAYGFHRFARVPPDMVEVIERKLGQAP